MKTIQHKGDRLHYTVTCNPTKRNIMHGFGYERDGVPTFDKFYELLKGLHKSNGNKTC